MLRSFALATLVGVTAAQTGADCSSMALGLYRANGDATPEACQLLLDFEACVAQVSDDSERSTLEIDLNQQQQQFAACGSAEPLTASIRTSRDAIDFSGRDFTSVPPQTNLLTLVQASYIKLHYVGGVFI